MSLLTSATLFVTPNGYKEGKLYSIIPSNGNGDFTVVRATTATRVDSSNLVKEVPVNLLGYSQVYNIAYWDKGLTTVVDNYTLAPNRTTTAAILTESVGTGSHHIHELTGSFNPVIGTAYTMSCYVKRPATAADQFIQLPFWIVGFGVNAYVNFDLLNGIVGTIGSAITSYSITSVGDGWFRLSATATATSTGKSGFQLSFISSATAPRTETYTVTAGSEESVYLWGAQMVQGTSALTYQITTTRLNIPRLDYSLGSCPNLLLEPQRTNLALRSEQFDDATWSKINTVVSANSTTSPSGVMNADTITGDGILGNHQATQSISYTSGLSYTYSIYAKKGTNNFIQFTSSFSAFGANSYANFDLNNGVLGTIGSTATATITSVGNGWYRCTMTSTATATLGGSIANTLITSAASARAEANTLTTSVFIWGAQFEAGTYASSYIPTTSASITRNADLISLSNVYTNGLVSAIGGTWFVELRNNIVSYSDAAGDALLLSDSGNTAGNTLRIASGSNSRKQLLVKNGATSTLVYTTLTNTVKIAFKWNGTTVDVFVNGVKVVTAIAFTTTALQFINSNGLSTNNINQMALFPTPLTDDQLELLTGDSFNTYAEMASFYNYTLQ
jgi:hypothetical protein